MINELETNEENMTQPMFQQVGAPLELLEIVMTVKADLSTGKLLVEAIPVGVFVSENADGRYKYFPTAEHINVN